MDAYDDFYVANMPGIQKTREEHEEARLKEWESFNIGLEGLDDIDELI